MVSGAVVAVASYTKMFPRPVNDLVKRTKDKTQLPARRELMVRVAVGSESMRGSWKANSGSPSGS